MLKRIGFTFVIIFLMGVCAVVADRLAAKNYKSNSTKIKVEVGDILFRSYSFALASSSWYKFSGFPGHVAIVISENEMALNSNSLKNILVVEARYFDHAKKQKCQNVGVNAANENFGEKYQGRRFLLKTHLTASQKQKLLYYYKSELEKPYSLFAQKQDTSVYNCATFARHTLLHCAQIDIDPNGGKVFFPNDIFNHELFQEKNNRIQF
ncbi:hypothetical protein [uncultured Draconibacterium sp.]|uniref:hypothetical protein n=1 Tax=uncultured Draconibacterium sp. TaxID=1573823 RepID=UPI0032162A25